VNRQISKSEIEEGNSNIVVHQDCQIDIEITNSDLVQKQEKCEKIKLDHKSIELVDVSVENSNILEMLVNSPQKPLTFTSNKKDITHM